MRAPVLALALLALPAAAQSFRTPDSGGTPGPVEVRDELTEAHRAEIRRTLDANVADLRTRGLLPEATAAEVPLGWPLRAADGLMDPGVHGTSNFVDLDPANPGSILDYTCGARTYDQTGYNHAGIDYFTWPFGWAKMDSSEVEVVAAADGVIIGKDGGRPDRSCQLNGTQWNAVYVQHADGSVAWYGHLKRGSLTTQPVGASVAAGEYLGVVGSSGNSTGPHLHFELYDAEGQIVEPHAGPCNDATPTSWWIEQRPYYDSAINALYTHTIPPAFPSCPNTVDRPNLDDEFYPGESVITAAYYRDQLAGQATTYEVLRPDGSTFDMWTHASGATHYAASYWYWTTALPLDAPTGTWTFRATFEGQTAAHAFAVLPPVGAEDVPEAPTFALRPPVPNPTAGGATLDLVVDRPQRVRAVVLDALGRAVATLFDGRAEAIGPHRLTFDGEGLPSGAYVVRAQGEAAVAVRRVTLVR